MRPILGVGKEADGCGMLAPSKHVTALYPANAPDYTAVNRAHIIQREDVIHSTTLLDKTSSRGDAQWRIIMDANALCAVCRRSAGVLCSKRLLYNERGRRLVAAPP
jgi:hypothetical protein